MKKNDTRVVEPAQPEAERATAAENQPAPPSHMRHWSAMARPPRNALKTIKGGRLQGMTDVNPQWRYQTMTQEFGPCGIGWKYEIDRMWTEPGCDGEVLAFAQVSVRVAMDEGLWSDPVYGIGGNHMIVKEKAGLRNNDECWKMAVTDALSVALKMLGVAADIYAGLWDGSKYITPAAEQEADAAPDDAYVDWLTDMGAVAEEGYPTMVAAIRKSNEAFQARLRADGKTWAALKAKAEKHTAKEAVPA